MAQWSISLQTGNQDFRAPILIMIEVLRRTRNSTRQIIIVNTILIEFTPKCNLLSGPRASWIWARIKLLVILYRGSPHFRGSHCFNFWLMYAQWGIFALLGDPLQSHYCKYSVTQFFPQSPCKVGTLCTFLVQMQDNYVNKTCLRRSQWRTSDNR